MEKTATLLITTHGWYNIDSKDKPMRFRVPANMEIITYTNARTGECNFMGETDIRQYLAHIIPSLPMLKTGETENTLDYLNTRFQDINYNIASDTLKSTKRKRIELTNDELDFIRNSYYNKTQSATVKKSGEFMNNKEYEFKVKNNSNYDYKILQIDDDGKIINNIGNNVLGINKITRSTRSNQETNLSDIIDYLKEQEYIRVVIFDFSCEVMTRNNNRVSRRTTRRVRRKNMNAGKYSRTHKKGIIRT